MIEEITYTLKLEIPDELYQKLFARAEKENKTIEQVAIEILEKAYLRQIAE